MLFIRTILAEAFKWKQEYEPKLRIKLKTLFMSNEEKHGHHFDLPLFLICPSNYWLFGGFECRVCKPGASRELGLRPQGLRSFKCSKLIFGNITVVIGPGTNLNIWFLNKRDVLRAVNPLRMIESVFDQHQLIKSTLCTYFEKSIRSV